MRNSTPKEANMATKKKVPASTHPKWDEQTKAFAEACGVKEADVNTALVEYFGEADDAHLEMLSSTSSVPDGDLADALVRGGPGVKMPKFRHNLHVLRGIDKATPATSETANGASMGMFVGEDPLPKFEEGDALLDALKVGGRLKHNASTVAGLVRVSVAENFGLLDLDKKIAAAMEEYADQMVESVPDVYWEVDEILQKSAWSDLLRAMKVRASFVSPKRQNELMRRVNQVLWPSLNDFQTALSAWREEWRGSREEMLFAAVAQNNPMFGGMPDFTPPDPMMVRSALEGLNEKVNRVLSGVMVPVAKGMTAKANRMLEILHTDNLHLAMGAPNQEEMFRRLSVGVSIREIEMEKIMARFVLAALELKKVPSGGQEEIRYMWRLHDLGRRIDWNVLSGKSTGGHNVREPQPFGGGARS